MATEDEEFEEGALDNDEDDVGAVEKSADPQRITRRIRLVTPTSQTVGNIASGVVV